MACLRWKYLVWFSFGVVYLPPANEVAGRSCFQNLSVFHSVHKRWRGVPCDHFLDLFKLVHLGIPSLIQPYSEPLTIQGPSLPDPSRHVQTWTPPYRTPPLDHGTICSLGPHHAGTPNSLPQLPLFLVLAEKRVVDLRQKGLLVSIIIKGCSEHYFIIVLICVSRNEIWFVISVCSVCICVK